MVSHQRVRRTVRSWLRFWAVGSLGEKRCVDCKGEKRREEREREGGGECELLTSRSFALRYTSASARLCQRRSACHLIRMSLLCTCMPASGTSTASLFSSGHVLLSHRLFSCEDILSFSQQRFPHDTDARHLRQVVGSRPWRGVLYVIVTWHVLCDDGHHIVLVLGKQEGRCQAHYSSSEIICPVSITSSGTFAVVAENTQLLRCEA